MLSDLRVFNLSLEVFKVFLVHHAVPQGLLSLIELFLVVRRQRVEERVLSHFTSCKFLPFLASEGCIVHIVEVI